MKKKQLFSVLLIIAVLCLCGCAKSYSESEIEEIRRQAYDEGYDSGYEDGEIDGYHDGLEAGFEDGIKVTGESCYKYHLIDGESITDLRDEVYRKYGLTPDEAFSMVDEYEYDSTHGGITWAEYQNAIEAIYYTAYTFPCY